jgi:3-oxoacyl-[acyl-carrier protein] reductase
MTKLAGKIAIVTASSRGIGRAVAKRLSRDGAKVVVNYVASPEKAEALVKEIGHRQVTVNLVSPGVTDTDGLVMPQAAIDGLIQQTPLGRLGQPDDIADVVAFLVSDDAHWVTGQNIQANGGIL